MLRTIMKKQLEFQQSLGVDFSSMSPEERAAYMRDQRGYLDDEVAEALYEMPFYKSWKDYSKMSEEEYNVAWQKVRMELIDALHFFVNILLAAGMTPAEVCEMYLMKNKENHRRQTDGYTADKSYREQSVDDVVEPLCSVYSPERSFQSNSFVVATNNGDDVDLTCNTDLATMIVARHLLSKSIAELMADLTPEQKKEAKKFMEAYKDE